MQPHGNTHPARTNLLTAMAVAANGKTFYLHHTNASKWHDTISSRYLGVLCCVLVRSTRTCQNILDGYVSCQACGVGSWQQGFAVGVSGIPLEGTGGKSAILLLT